MSTDNLSFEQRVVYAGLSRMTTDRNLIQTAFTHWMKTLSQKPFDVVEIVDNMIEYLGINSAEKKVFMIALHAASNKLYDELPAVPTIMLEGGATANPQSAQGATQSSDVATDQDKVVKSQAPHIIITTQYLQQFVLNVRKNDAADYDELRNILADEGLEELGNEHNQLVKTWASNGLANLKLPDDLSEADCKAVAHELYMLTSEVIGPNTADDIVNRVVSSLMNIEASTRFHPRNLL